MPSRGWRERVLVSCSVASAVELVVLSPSSKERSLGEGEAL